MMGRGHIETLGSSDKKPSAKASSRIRNSDIWQR